MRLLKNIKALAICIAACIAFSLPSLVSVRAEEDPYVNYVLSDTLTEYNAGNWSVYQQPYMSSTVPVRYVEPVTFSGGINFSNDFTKRGEAYEGARVMSNVAFSAKAEDAAQEASTVFDLSFVVYQNNKENRMKDISYGVLCGMPEKDASYTQGLYFELTSHQFFMYKNGAKVSPEYWSDGKYVTEDALPQTHTKNGFGGYIEFDLKLTARLVARSDGYLYCYFGFADGKEISEVYCRFGVFDFDGYLGFTATSHVEEKTAFSLNFDSVKLSGTTKADYDFNVISASVDTESLTGAVLSERPIALSAEIVTAPNLEEYHRAVFSVVQGNAEIRNGNMLYLLGEGEVVVRAASYYDPEIYQDYSFRPTDLEVTSIQFTNNFDGITVNTQPFRLIASVESNSYIPEHNSVRFEVVSGPAEIFCEKYLKITGPGTVVIRATSSCLDDVFVTQVFEVTDPDAAYLPGAGGEASSSCSASAVGISSAAAAALILAAILLLKK